MTDPLRAEDPPPTEVLIIGAGPTGLFAAALLHRCGVDVRIVDKSPGPAKESRALAVQSRTVELFSFLGLADRMLERGVIAAGARLHLDGRRVAELDLGLVGRAENTPYPVVLVLSQAETEAILVEHLAENGIQVERGVTVETLAQDAEGVRVGAVRPDGERVDMRALYALGADGAHSLVRKALGLRFEGAAYPQSFLLADCEVAGLPEQGPFNVFFHGTDFAIFAPIRGGTFGRVIVTDREAPTGPGAPGQGSAPATLGEIEAAFRRAACLDLKLTNEVWTSRYRVHHRGVDRYREGRVFVAGDAAHIHSPAGGQGMNTGLQDAANLAWKLALQVKGRAPPALVDSYDGERRPVGKAVLAATDRMFTAATGLADWQVKLRDILLPVVGGTLLRSDAIRSRAFHFVSQLGVRYQPGPAVQDGGGSGVRWSTGPAPGRRAPDAAIARGLSVFDLIGGYRFNLLAFSKKPLSEAAIEERAAALDELAWVCGPGASGHLVGHSLIGRHPRLKQAEMSDALVAYGITDAMPEGLYLIRPDGHVAWRAPGFDLDACRNFMAERFSRPLAS